MKVIITCTFCCDNLSKSKRMALEKPGKLRIFFSYFVATLLHHMLHIIVDHMLCLEKKLQIYCLISLS